MKARIQQFISNSISGLNDQFWKNLKGALGIQVISMSFTFITNWYVSSELTDKGLIGEYGTYVSLFVYVMTFGLISGGGVATLVTRLLPEYKVKKMPDKARGVVRFSHLLIAGVAIAIGVTLYFVNDSISFFDEKTDQGVFKFVVPLIPIYALITLHQSIQRGMHRIPSSMYPELIIRPFLFLIAVIVIYKGFPELFNAYNLVMANTVIFGIVLLVTTFLTRTTFPPAYPSTTITYDYKKWMRSIWILLPMGLVGILNDYVDVLMLNKLSGATEVGLYNIPLKLAALMVIPIVLINRVLAPLISEHYAKNDMQQLQEVVTKTTRIVTFCGLFILLGLILLGKPLLNFHHEDFVGGYDTLIILASSKVIHLMVASASYLLTMTGHETQALKALTVGVLGNIIINYLLIPSWGMNGAAVASTCSLFLWNLISIYYVRKYLHIRPTIFKF